jgi:hypothetical protein
VVGEINREGDVSNASFDDWTGGHDLATIGTNAGSTGIAYQGWKPFKEAFAPELIREAIYSSSTPISGLLDPFGGSGTSALAAQFLGVHPITAEVNPFLADVIAAKLSTYDLKALNSEFEQIMSSMRRRTSPRIGLDRFLPPTFVEPGVRSRYLFSAVIAGSIFDLTDAMSELSGETHTRFFKVILSSLMIEFSNARISGKGRRYRSNWSAQTFDRTELLAAYASRVQTAFADIARFGHRRTLSYDLIEGDSRVANFSERPYELVVFSPPYPNSFDYTDVYNIELWMLGYLTDWTSNTDLRQQTLSSHVQVPRDFSPAPRGSKELDIAVERLANERDRLWDKRLPEMVGGYFADLVEVVMNSSKGLSDGGEFWMVVGDSRYADIDVRVADILADLMMSRGAELVEKRAFRSMRASPQQGGRRELAETLVVMRNPSGGLRKG